MKYRQLRRFRSDYKSLKPEEREKFREALADFIQACREYEKHPEHYVWPKRLRVEKLHGTSILAMTWSFAQPDGRATFQFRAVDGDLWIIWRRIGRHSIYREP